MTADKLKLWKVEIPDDRNDLLSDLSLQDNDELLATRDIGDYWIEKPPKKHINVIVKLPRKCLTQNLFCTSVIMRVCTLQMKGQALIWISFISCFR